MSQPKRVAAVFLCVLLGGLLVLANAAGKKHREVEIDRDSCQVDAEAINVSKPKQQDVHWVIDQDATDGDTFTVKFDKPEGSPCLDKDPASPPRIEFKVIGKQKSDSCRLHPKAAVIYKEYRYSIYSADGTKCNDPSVVVQNGRHHDGKENPGMGTKKP